MLSKSAFYLYFHMFNSIYSIFVKSLCAKRMLIFDFMLI